MLRGRGIRDFYRSCKEGGKMRTRKARRQMKEAMIQYQSAKVDRVDRGLLGWVSVFLGEGRDVIGQMEGV